MPQPEVVDSFAEDAHLDLSEGPKSSQPWDAATSSEELEEEEIPETEQQPVSQPEPTRLQLSDGSFIEIEKTGRGWKATADAGTGKPAEVFYGGTKDELLQNVLIGKMNATRKINELKRKVVLGVDETEQEEVPETPAPKRKQLSADEIFQIKAELESNPDLAFEKWFQMRTGKTPEELLAIAEEGQGASEELIVEGILKDWVNQTADYVQSPKNAESLSAWLLKYKLGINPTGRTLANALPTLYRSGKLTEKNLTLAWEDLKNEGLVDVEGEQPAPVTEVNTTTVRRPRASVGIRSRETTMRNNDEQVLTKITVADIEALPDAEIDRLYSGVLQMARDPRTRPQVDAAIARAREKNR